MNIIKVNGIINLTKLKWDYKITLNIIYDQHYITDWSTEILPDNPVVTCELCNLNLKLYNMPM